VNYDTLHLRPPATNRCSNRHLFRLTAVQSLLCTSLCVAAAKSAGHPHHGHCLPPLSRPRPQLFCRVTVDASTCYSYCINNITLRIRKCRQHIKTSQMRGDTSLSYGLDGRAVGHPPCIAGPSRLFSSPHRSSHNHAIAPTHQTLPPWLISRPTALVGKCTKSISGFIPDFQLRYPDLRKFLTSLVVTYTLPYAVQLNLQIKKNWGWDLGRGLCPSPGKIS